MTRPIRRGIRGRGLHSLSASWAEILATWAQRSEDANFVNGEETNEGKEIEDCVHSQSASWAEILATWTQRSEDANFVAVHVQQIVVNGQQANEGEEIEDGLHTLSTSEIMATWAQHSEDANSSTTCREGRHQW